MNDLYFLKLQKGEVSCFIFSCSFSRSRGNNFNKSGSKYEKVIEERTWKEKRKREKEKKRKRDRPKVCIAKQTGQTSSKFCKLTNCDIIFIQCERFEIFSFVELTLLTDDNTNLLTELNHSINPKTFAQEFISLI